MRIKKWARYLCLLATLFLLSGCGEQDVSVLIDQGSETAKDVGQEVGQAAGQVADTVSSGYQEFRFSTIPEFWYSTCVTAKRWAPVLIVGSILLGLSIYSIFKKNKDIQRFALMTLILRIPLVVLLFVYVYAFLYGVLN